MPPGPIRPTPTAQRRRVLRATTPRASRTRSGCLETRVEQGQRLRIQTPIRPGVERSTGARRCRPIRPPPLRRPEARIGPSLTSARSVQEPSLRASHSGPSGRRKRWTCSAHSSVSHQTWDPSRLHRRTMNHIQPKPPRKEVRASAAPALDALGRSSVPLIAPRHERRLPGMCALRKGSGGQGLVSERHTVSTEAP